MIQLVHVPGQFLRPIRTGFTWLPRETLISTKFTNCCRDLEVATSRLPSVILPACQSSWATISAVLKLYCTHIWIKISWLGTDTSINKMHANEWWWISVSHWVSWSRLGATGQVKVVTSGHWLGKSDDTEWFMRPTHSIKKEKKKSNLPFKNNKIAGNIGCAFLSWKMVKRGVWCCTKSCDDKKLCGVSWLTAALGCQLTRVKGDKKKTKKRCSGKASLVRFLWSAL